MRKTESQLDNLISIVESFYSYQQKMTEEQYLLMMRNCVYSLEKAMELMQNLKELANIWFSFKSEMQLKSTQQAANQTLKTPMKALKQSFKDTSRTTSLNQTAMEKTTMSTAVTHQKDKPSFGLHNLEILIRMLPYWDVPLYTDADESNAVTIPFTQPQ